MPQARHGDTVAVNYTCALNDGRVFETSDGSGPLRFRVGGNELIPPAPLRAIEQTVIGMEIGESRTVRVAASEAYGSRDEGLVAVVDRNRFPANLALRLGMELDVFQGDDTVYPVTVTDITDSSVTLDANHPLAGKDLVLHVFLVEIK
jgi:peptidylprolyl isomerase